MQKNAGKIAGTAILMVFITLLSKALGMYRDILLASFFGMSSEAVAYEAASRLPLNLFDFALGGVVTAAFIPIFNECMVKEGKRRAFDFANRYFNLIFWITAAIAALGVLLSPQLITFFAPKLDPETRALAIPLSRIMFPMIIFTGAAFCFVGVLQSFERYTLPAIMSLVSNLVMVVYFFLFCDRFGVYGLSAALVVGWFLQAAIQAPAAHRLGFRYRPTFAFSDPLLRRALKMAFPVLVCSWLQPVCNTINTRFASGFAEGRALTAVGYANRLYIIVVGVFSFVATNLLFPKLSRAEAGGDKAGARGFAASSIKILLYIMLPLAAGVYLLSEPLIRTIYMRGEFTAADAELTASVLRLFALGIPFMSVNEVLTKLFFAGQRVKAPMIASVVSIIFNIGFVTLLVSTIGLDGIGIASSATIALCAILNYVFLSRDGGLLSRRDFSDLFRALIAAAVMTLGVYFADRGLPIPSDLLRTVICGAVGVFLYGGVLLLLKPSEVGTLLSSLFGRKSHD